MFTAIYRANQLRERIMIWKLVKFVLVMCLWWFYPLQMIIGIVALLGMMALISSLPDRRRASTPRARQQP